MLRARSWLQVIYIRLRFMYSLCVQWNALQKIAREGEQSHEVRGSGRRRILSNAAGGAEGVQQRALVFLWYSLRTSRTKSGTHTHTKSMHGAERKSVRVLSAPLSSGSRFRNPRQQRPCNSIRGHPAGKSIPSRTAPGARSPYVRASHTYAANWRKAARGSTAPSDHLFTASGFWPHICTGMSARMAFMDCTSSSSCSAPVSTNRLHL